ncbi:hypothetical protein BHM03_00049514 [Ensete ventricosum]|uniref:Uncharacterized protein n=1 Tax=Ensete ventricosum TaxID=4639 RepID=A0A445MLJ3_ENSVE|nr:hypothetical protein BHM03_00049514 [Ensete ventricosum]
MACRRPLARKAIACAAFFCMWPLLNAAAVSRSWQTRMRLPLDAATAYAHASQQLLIAHMITSPSMRFTGTCTWTSSSVVYSPHMLMTKQRVELVSHFSRLRTYPFYAEEKVLMLHGIEFRSRLGMGTNTLSSVYKPLHKYRIIRVSNSPHLRELCITLMVIKQHIPLYTVLSFTKRPTLP